MFFYVLCFKVYLLFLRILVFILLPFFCLISCQADPSSKKVTLVERQVVNKSVKDRYKPFLDILFVIDSSGSMDSKQEILAKNADQFVNEFLKTDFIDYRIAVTPGAKTNDQKAFFLPCIESSGKDKGYKNYVDKKTSKATECLREMLVTHSVLEKLPHHPYFAQSFYYTPMPSGNIQRMDKPSPEIFLEVIVDTLTDLLAPVPRPRLTGAEKVVKKSFYRHSAHLALIVITDTDEGGSVNHDVNIVNETYNYLLNIKNGEENKLHYVAGVVIVPRIDYGCYSQNVEPDQPALLGMMDKFGPRGYAFNLCQFNYGGKLANIARRLIDSVLTAPLDQTPDLASIKVSYQSSDGREQVIPNDPDEGWTYDPKRNAIQLSREIELEPYEDGDFSIQYKAYYGRE